MRSLLTEIVCLRCGERYWYISTPQSPRMPDLNGCRTCLSVTADQPQTAADPKRRAA